MEGVDKIAAWLRNFDAEEQDRLLKQAKLKAVNDTPTDDLLKAPISTLGEYLDTEIETPPEIVKPGIIVRGEVHVLAARAGKGKTTFLMNLLMRLSAGKPLFDDLPDLFVPGFEGGVKSLVIENEGSAGYFQDRCRELLENGGYSDDEKELALTNLLVWGDGSYSGMKIDEAAKLETLRRGMKQHRPDLVFLDPFASIWTGEENSNSEMRDALDKLMQLCKDFECAVFLNHHENKNKDNIDGMDALRGGTAFEGLVATAMRWQHIKGGDQSELSFSKMRYKGKKGEPAPIRMRFDFETWTYEHVGESVLDRQILKMLGESPTSYLTVADIAEDLDESARKIRGRLKSMLADKRVSRIMERGEHRYRIITPGEPTPENGGLDIG